MTGGGVELGVCLLWFLERDPHPTSLVDHNHNQLLE